MYNKLELDNQQGSVLSLPFDSIANGYAFKGAEGLNPVKASVSSSTFANLDGAQPGGARRDIRNILVKIGFERDWGVASKDVRTLRRDLHAYLMPKTPVVLRWYNDDALYATIDGLVESCEDSPFTQDPEAVASIICFKPNFTMPAVQVAGNTVSTATEQTVTSGGTVESGYVFTLNINRTLAAFSLFNRRPNGDMAQLDVTYNFLAGDVVKISTQPNNKYITLTRAGVTSSILYAVTAGGKWGPLWPGANYIRALATGAAIPFTIDYIPLLGGL